VQASGLYGSYTVRAVWLYFPVAVFQRPSSIEGYDAAAEFTRYLLANVAVLIIVFVIVCPPERRQTPLDPPPESQPGSRGDADPK
jgi:hypothetical protein